MPTEGGNEGTKRHNAKEAWCSNPHLSINCYTDDVSQKMEPYTIKEYVNSLR